MFTVYRCMSYNTSHVCPYDDCMSKTEQVMWSMGVSPSTHPPTAGADKGGGGGGGGWGGHTLLAVSCTHRFQGSSSHISGVRKEGY